MLDVLTFAPAAFDTMFQNLRGGYIGPLFMLILMVFAIGFLKNRQWLAMFSFIGFAVVIGLIIFRTENFFGDSGVLTDTADTQAQEAFSAIKV